MKIQTPDQTAAIKKLMTGRRAAWRKDPRGAGDFPKWKAGMTTADYIRVFSIGSQKHVLPYDLARYAGPAPAVQGVEVTAELLAA